MPLVPAPRPSISGEARVLIGVEVADGVGFAERGRRRGRLGGGGGGEGEREEGGKDEIQRAPAKPLVHR